MLMSFLYFLAAAVLLTLAPGPDNLYLLAKSLASGAKSGISLAAGLASGIAFHTLLVIVGVATLLKESPTAFAALRYIGAAYLLWLAWHAFQEKGDLQLAPAGDAAEYGALYRRGILMNVLNPKVLLFFLALLPQFIQPQAALDPKLQIALYGVTFAVQAFIIFSAIAVFAGKVRGFILHVHNLNRIFGILQGLVLSFIALALLFGM